MRGTNQRQTGGRAEGFFYAESGGDTLVLEWRAAQREPVRALQLAHGVELVCLWVSNHMRLVGYKPVPFDRSECARVVGYAMIIRDHKPLFECFQGSAVAGTMEDDDTIFDDVPVIGEEDAVFCIFDQLALPLLHEREWHNDESPAMTAVAVTITEERRDRR